MGSCLSSSSPSETPAAISVMTTKVIMLSGALAEFSSPFVTASLVLPPSCFLCDSDDLRIDLPAPEIPADELLLQGRLYFVIHETMRGAPLPGTFLAELAVRASAALAGAAAKASEGIDERLKKKKKRRLGLVMPVFEKECHSCWDAFSLSPSSSQRKEPTLQQVVLTQHDVSTAVSTLQKNTARPPPRLKRKASIRARLVRRLSGRSRLTPIEEVDE